MSNIFALEKEFYNKEFTDLTCSGQKIHEAEFDNCTFVDCDFYELAFNGSKFSECKFIKCNLSLINVVNCQFSNVEFADCKMLGIDWTKAYWRGLALGLPLAFKNCLINSSSFYGLKLHEILIGDCIAHDVDFREADLTLASFTGTDLSNSLFSNTNLISADFYSATNYDIDLNTNKIDDAKFCRYEAVRLLESLGINLVD